MLVVDASVILKWLLSDPKREPDTDKAFKIMLSIVEGTHEILQPVHWLAETAAVMARLSPQTAARDIAMLSAMQFAVDDEPAVLKRATKLAIESGQHVFDTLYHAVAMANEGALLVTADMRYLEKAGHYGCIQALSDTSVTG